MVMKTATFAYPQGGISFSFKKERNNACVIGRKGWVLPYIIGDHLAFYIKIE